MVEIQHLSFSYEQYGNSGDHKRLLQDVNLSVEKREKILILGAPDSGKSTLARIMCNLVPRFIAGELEGNISLAGENIAEIPVWDLLERCTLVAQNPQEQLLMTTCADEVAFPLEAMGVRREDLIGRVHQALHTWGLESLIDVNPQEMSGGERKRLLLAVAEAINAPIWVMDEPFDDLDEQWRSRLSGILERSDKTVVLFASRYLEEFRGSFDAYGLLVDGHLEIGPEEDIAIQFDRQCDAQFGTTITEIAIPEFHGLRATDLTIVHPRKSVSSSVPFTLQVPEFHVDSAEVIALVGPNGSGKSTLSRVLCGLDPYQSGTITLDDSLVTQKTLRTKVGYLFQNPDYGIFLPTVRDELGWSLRHIPNMTAQKRENLIQVTADAFHLNCEDNPTMMSYGSRKHLQAGVYHLLNRPFLIIDELDSGVTYAAAFEMISLLREHGAAIIIITHDRSFARNIAQRQYRIEDGVVRETEVFS